MSTPSKLSGRLMSLDAFRGLSVAGMILVNNPGSWEHIYTPLGHAEWHGWTLTDLIFPFFLFILGVSITFSFGKRKTTSKGKLYRGVFRRSLVIYALGLFLSAFPNFDVANLRYVGVLARISIVYLVTSLLVINLSRRALAWVTVILLFGYWALMTLVPVPGHGAGVLTQEGNLAGWVDRFVVPGRMYQVTWDPEGLVSTLPAVATALLGVFTGNWLRSARPRTEIAKGMFAAGCVAIALGSLWDLYFPINKNLWTSSFVVFTAGAALVVLAALYWVIDVKGHRKWARPLVAFGVNAISAFFLSGIVARLLVNTQVSVEDGTVSLKTWLFDNYFATWAPPNIASLAFALAFLGALWLLVELLYKKQIFIKV